MTTRRSTGKMHVGRALWYAKAGSIEIRTAPVPPVKPGEARVRTLWSGVSRGTERLVFQGAVAKSEWGRMRAPAQEGDFPFPVKYGYCATGTVEEGPAELLGRTVFALHPHQDMFVFPADRLALVPDAIPARRATLAANMETALNAHWDAASGPGDRIAIVGAGIVGLMVAHLAARIPGADVTVIDTNPSRQDAAEALGAAFLALPAGADRLAGLAADVVFHTSASSAGLDTAIACAGPEATIVELSWYGERPATISLGGAFHSQRLRLVSSQVGQVATTRRPRWSYRRRLEKALALLSSPSLDKLLTEEIAFADAPGKLPAFFAPDCPALAPVIRY